METLYLFMILFTGITVAQQPSPKQEETKGLMNSTGSTMAITRDEFNALKIEFEEMQQHVGILQQENLKLKQAMLSIKPPMQATNVNFVGFYVYHGSETSYAPDSTIIFPTVVTNLGPAGSLYDPVTGTFHCGVPGVYFFSVSLLGYGGEIYATLNVGGIQYAWVHVPDSGKSIEGSNSLVVHCANEDVQVKIFDKTSSVHCCQYSTFTGYLLYMD